ncbi:MAG: four-helix bundle copper-binding protein [Paludisphaera borealis]|uniref:four-helix bundle copper-binding protein n=1 Tax=Paludisphaera borealis TaxID=1387353 RepID=UPI0028412CE2|nr:four-helix bundle copper-binding protein [Paludisphaera borealis]MDR3621096.1 four-helix bundle copper-binding protein [Paludisphaera borealis]
MERRELLGMLGVGAAGLLMSGSAKGAPGDSDEEKQARHEHLEKMGKCALVCNATAHHCLEQLKKEGSENREVHAKALEMTNDCQSFCVQAATLMARHSPLAMYAHQACADACRDCAAACEKGQDEVMKKCAEACRACEQACRACCAKAA